MATKKHSNPNTTPLHVAIKDGNHEGVKVLLEQGADVNVKDCEGDTPLHEGINSYEIVKTLLDKGALLDIENSLGNTPLHLAAREGNVEVVNLLISAGAKINTENIHGDTPLDKAICNSCHEVIAMLISKGAELEPILSGQRCPPLHLAVLMNDCLAVQLLLDAGANPNSRDQIPKCHLEQDFVSQEERATVSNCTSLILEVGTALHLATAHEFVKIVRILLDKGADPNIRNVEGETPLHLSASYADFQSVRLLLQKGADVNVKRISDGYTPLHLASQTDEDLVVEMLFHAGADLNMRNDSGGTALHVAAKSGSVECIERLLMSGADLNANNAKGDRPLHVAVDVGSCSYRAMEVVDTLLDWGASIDDVNNEGKTPLNIAQEDKLFVLKKHLVKLIAIPLRWNENIDLTDFEEFRLSCLKELKCMKEKRYFSHSLFDIFAMYNDPQYVNNDLLEQVLVQLEPQFPIYDSLLKLMFKKAKLRYKMMFSVVEYFNVNLFPFEMKWKILTYLSDSELEHVLKAVAFKD